MPRISGELTWASLNSSGRDKGYDWLSKRILPHRIPFCKATFCSDFVYLHVGLMIVPGSPYFDLITLRCIRRYFS